MRIDYHTTTRVWLHLEDYHNAGLTSKNTKEVIEQLRFGGTTLQHYLYCEPSDPSEIAYMVEVIGSALRQRLAIMKQKGECRGTQGH